MTAMSSTFSYVPLPEHPQPAVSPADQRRLPIKLLSVLLVSSFIALVLFNSQQDQAVPLVNEITNSGRSPVNLQPRLSRGVSQGVSEKAFTVDGDVEIYPWTNVMLSWQRTSYHFQPEKNWMNDPNGCQIYVSQLQRGREERKLIIRVTRMWYSYNPRKDMELMSMDFIAKDEKEDHVHCIVRSRFVPDFTGLIKEGDFYVIKNFNVDTAKPTYRAVRRDLIVTLDASSRVDEIISKLPSISRYAFDLIPYDDLTRVGGERRHLCDIIGYVVGISETGQRVCSQRLTMLQYVEMLDLSEKKLRLTIWGSEMINMAKSISVDESRVWVITGTIVNLEGNGVFSVSTSSATNFYSDRKIKEIADFENGFVELGYNEPVKNISMHNSLITREEYNKNKKTVAYAASLLQDGDSLTSPLYVYATIVRIDERNGWKYNACTLCKHKVHLKDGKLHCEYCHRDEAYPVLRYRLEVDLEEDGT